MCKEKDTGTTVSVNVTYYTKASFDTALEFYRNILRSYNRYNETAIETDDGPWYTMKFSTTVSGGYEMDASLTVSRADESAGYECLIAFTGAIRTAGNED